MQQTLSQETINALQEVIKIRRDYARELISIIESAFSQERFTMSYRVMEEQFKIGNFLTTLESSLKKTIKKTI